MFNVASELMASRHVKEAFEGPEDKNISIEHYNTHEPRTTITPGRAVYVAAIFDSPPLHKLVVSSPTTLNVKCGELRLCTEKRF